jgi:SAM-dependent methyltransferase
MSDWEERITRDTPPSIQVEHELRYRLVAPLIASSGVWADLGCGTGVGAARALAGARPRHAVLVDVAADAVEAAAGELGMPEARQIAGDLTDARVIAQVGEALLAADGPRVVSCFEVVEHLSTFVPLLEWAGRLAREGSATFVLSVPNDAFWSIENPYHQARWGEGAFEELRALLPDEHTLLRQVSLSGSALTDWDGTAERHEVAVEVGGPATIPTHLLAAFGPRHAELRRGAAAAQTDLLAQRRWERQRDSNLAFAEARLVEDAAEFERWRAYIHELERELGRPLSGTQQPE